MRRFFLLLLLTMATGSLHAQQVIDCETGQQLESGLIIRLLNTTEGLPYSVTLLGIDGFDPALAIENTAGVRACSDNEAAAAFYQLDLPGEDEVPFSESTAQLFFPGGGDLTTLAGSFDGDTGSLWLVIEGVDLSEGDGPGDLFEVTIPDGMIESGAPLKVIAMAGLPETGVDPALALVDANGRIINDADGRPISCEDSDKPDRCYGSAMDLSQARLTSFFGELAGLPTDAALTVPLDEGMAGQTLRFRVSSSRRTYGPYLVLIRLATGSAQPQEAAADVTDGEAGVILTCEGQPVFENGLRIGFPHAPAGGLQLLILNDAIEAPVVAVVDEAGDGWCYGLRGGGDPAELFLPSMLSPFAFASGTRAPVMSEGSSLIVGGTAAEWILVVDGAAIEAAEDFLPMIELPLSPRQIDPDFLPAFYAVGASNTFNPMLTQVDESLEVVIDAEGQPRQCDNAGQSEGCWGSSSLLEGYYIVNAEGMRLLLTNVDTMLRPPLEDAVPLRLAVSSGDESTGPFVMVIHLKRSAPTDSP